MRKRSATRPLGHDHAASGSSTSPVGDDGTAPTPAPTTSRKLKHARKADPPRQDPVPQWLQDAAINFVAATPRLNWAVGFYDWNTWLNQLRNVEFWTRKAPDAPPPPWRTLIEACRASRQVCGTAALCRAKSDLLSVIINCVYRQGEPGRLAHAEQTAAPERDIMRRVRAVITRQRRHEVNSLTLIRFLDLAFVFSAFKDCRMHHGGMLARLDPVIEAELLFFEDPPTAVQMRENTVRMQEFMWEKRWLPWYEQVPAIRDEMVLSAREAAQAFCDGIRFPLLHVRAGVRGLSRDHMGGASSMNEWLMTLLEPVVIARWAKLGAVYNSVPRDRTSERDALLEEMSRRVVERVLEPLTEVKEGLDGAHCKLVDAAPGIVVTQAASIPGRFTFRQLLELFIYMTMFGQYLHSTFYRCSLPSIEQIQSGISLFDDIKKRVFEVRMLVDSDKVDMLFEWCLATTGTHSRDTHSTLASYGGCVSYQRSAIRAALGPSVMASAGRAKTVSPSVISGTTDALSCAGVIAEWDAALAAKIVDASIRIGRAVRSKFQNGKGGGLDLYTHRRVTVCEMARDRFHGDVRAAARVLSRLHAVWEECEADKGVGVFDARGAVSLQTKAETGNFEAAAVFGLLLVSDEWVQRRQTCNMMRDVETGMAHLCKAISLGDTAAAADMLHILKLNSGERRERGFDIAPHIVDKCVKCLRVSSRQEPALSLYLGYLYSVGVRGVVADCELAAEEYRRVLLSSTTSTPYQAYAANNLATLRALNGISSGVCGDSGKAAVEEKACELFRMASAAGSEKAASNMAAVLCLECGDDDYDSKQARQLYEREFHSPDGEVPVTVIRRDDGRKELKMVSMMVRRDKQQAFCNAVVGDGMILGDYGDVLVQESLALL